MQKRPSYKNITDEIMSFFRERIDFCEKNGIAEDRIILDPGIGFGKTVNHNLQILKNLDRFRTLGRPVLIGLSRKSFMGKLLGLNLIKGWKHRLP